MSGLLHSVLYFLPLFIPVQSFDIISPPWYGKTSNKIVRSPDVAIVSRRVSIFTHRYSRRDDDYGLPDSGRRFRHRNSRQNRKRKPKRSDINVDDNNNIHSYYLATCLPGIATILQDELTVLGCVNTEISGSAKAAVSFGVKDISTILRVLLWTRTAHKVMELLTISRQPLYTREDIYNFVRDSIPVNDLLCGSNSKQWLTLSVSVTFNNAKFIPADINHSHYTALNVKNALVDAAREVSADRPSVDTNDPDVPLIIVLRGIPPSNNMNDRNPRAFSPLGAEISVYRCIHAGSLHRRGYRFGSAVHKAAMKESTAAGLLLAAGWSSNSKGRLIDPMVGSGTFLLEGAMIAADIAPGIMRIKCGVPASRNPPIIRWQQNDDNNLNYQWNELLIDATKRAREGLQRLQSTPCRIIGNDAHVGALDLARHAVNQAGLEKVILLVHGDCKDFFPEDDSSGLPLLVVSNPPWGVRLTEDMHDSWEALRVFLRENCPGGTNAWILCGSPEATKHLGLRRSQSLPLKTGQQNLRWLNYVINCKEKTKTLKNDNGTDASPSQPDSSKTVKTIMRKRLKSVDAIISRTDENEWSA